MKQRIIKYFMTCLLIGSVISPVYSEGLDEPQIIGWDVLRQLNYQTGKMTSKLKNLDGKMVKLPGFAVPLDGDGNEFTKFLLVPTLGACIHVPPPPPNQTVYVEESEGVSADLTYYPIWVYGHLRILKSEHMLEGTSFNPEASFKLIAVQVDPYELE